MVQIDEILDKMDEAMDLSKSSDSPAMGPELPPSLAATAGKTTEDILADLNKSPLFMTDLEENDDVAALQALAYEGTPLENGQSFKDRGNETFKEKKWADAKEFYTKGIDILFVEERKRVKGEITTNAEGIPDTEDEILQQKATLETLYVNRAACHLELRNYRSCWQDCASALRLNPSNIKAFYRSARALLAVGRIEEADDACARGLAIDAENKALKAVARDIIKKSEEATAKQRKENERLSREKRRALLLKAALKARNITTRTTARPPEMEDARVQLLPDPDNPTSSLSFPVLLLYPLESQTDLITAFSEMDTVEVHLSYVLPPPWDAQQAYSPKRVECYMETLSGGLIKIGKKASLLKVLSEGNVEVVDGLVRILVVPRDKAEEFVRDFKRKKGVGAKEGK
jgi:tetratricopeptide (TPR) repeat protein